VADVTIAGLGKRFGETYALRELDLNIQSGEFIAVLGPSGCGKTTLLRLLAGFEHADEGTIEFDGQLQASSSFHRPPEHRGIGMVFQSYALWPHMSVAQNVGYPLRVRGTPREERDERIAAALEQVGLADLGARPPSELSGGQRQRVALARCLVMRPPLVLFDEPLANLDVHLRESMQTEFRAFHRESGATILYVTHDQAEAMALADRIVVMDKGILQQVAPPRELYDAPRTPMVAGFVGHGVVLHANIDTIVGDGTCRATIDGAPALLRTALQTPGPALACVRAERLELTEPGSSVVRGTVEASIYRGPVSSVVVRLSGGSQITVNTVDVPPANASVVGVRICDGWAFRAA
jgi:iron(III) transport system ATP-binding protein